MAERGMFPKNPGIGGRKRNCGKKDLFHYWFHRSRPKGKGGIFSANAEIFARIFEEGR